MLIRNSVKRVRFSSPAPSKKRFDQREQGSLSRRSRFRLLNQTTFRFRILTLDEGWAA